MKRLSYTIIMMIGCQIIGYDFVVHAYDTSNKNQGTVQKSAAVDTSIPSWFRPMDTTNLNDWLSIMPKQLHKYRDSDQFLVIPAMGMVTPINELSETNPDFDKALQGDFDYNKYLVSGPTIYPGTASIGQPGNTFIFAHSNYRVKKPGDFKTIFRLTYNIEPGDTILYYKKSGTTWTMYTYKVFQSMLVEATDVRVMLPEEGKQLLTLSACRPIGTAEKRWINRAELISQQPLDYQVAPQATTTTTTAKQPKTTPTAATTTNQPALIPTNSAAYIPGKMTQYAPRKQTEDIIAKVSANLALIVANMVISQ